MNKKRKTPKLPHGGSGVYERIYSLCKLKLHILGYYDFLFTSKTITIKLKIDNKYILGLLIKYGGSLWTCLIGLINWIWS